MYFFGAHGGTRHSELCVTPSSRESQPDVVCHSIYNIEQPQKTRGYYQRLSDDQIIPQHAPLRHFYDSSSLHS